MHGRGPRCWPIFGVELAGKLAPASSSASERRHERSPTRAADEVEFELKPAIDSSWNLVGRMSLKRTLRHDIVAAGRRSGASPIDDLAAARKLQLKPLSARLSFTEGTSGSRVARCGLMRLPSVRIRFIMGWPLRCCATVLRSARSVICWVTATHRLRRSTRRSISRHCASWRRRGRHHAIQDYLTMRRDLGFKLREAGRVCKSSSPSCASATRPSSPRSWLSPGRSIPETLRRHIGHND